MPLQETRDDARQFLHTLLGIWLGVYACRTYVPAAVWNISDALPLYLKGGLAIGVQLLGVIIGVLPFMRRRRAAYLAAIILAAITILRQIFLGSDVAGSVLSLLSWVAWLAWLGAIARRPHRWIAAAFAAGFAFQILMQYAWHGLDLPMARGPVAVLCAIVLSLLFVMTADKRDGTRESSWAFVAVGAAFFLELTLLANPGRMALAIGQQRLLFAVAQCAVVALIAIAALKPVKSAAAVFATGSIFFFALLFGFYNQYEWPLLWAVAAIIIVCAALPGFTRAASVARGSTTVAALILAATILLPRSTESHASDKTNAQLRIITYNIHQGFDAVGAPGMQQIVDEIAALNPDVIALQEVNRGWTFVGGADLVAYLRHRFPDYELHFVPVNGALWGVAMMSRLPMKNVSGGRFTAAPGSFGYGYVSGDVDYNGDVLHLIGLHLTAGLEGNGEDARDDQAMQLLRIAGARDNTVIMGDFNTHPEESPVQRILAAGYRDLGAEAGLTAQATWPASRPVERIDYMFGRGGFKTTSGRIPATLASDHLPLVVEISSDARRAPSNDHTVDPE